MSVEQGIRKKLEAAFQPEILDIVNESQRHHSPKGSESHFKVLMVSAVFQGLSRIQRQQKVNDLLKEEFAGPVHALTMRLHSPGEWAALPEEERKFRAIGHHPSGVRKPEQ